MTHHEIKQQEIIDRYIMHRLKATERQAFQEHYFGCDECFGKVQTAAQFVAGVKHSSRKGVLSEVVVEPAITVVAWWTNWFKPAFALASAAAILLAIGLGWTLFSQIPRLQNEVAQARQAREQAAREKDLSLQASKDELEKERQALATAKAEAKAEQEKLQAQLNQQIANNKPTNVPEPIGQVQVNAPIVLLESQRDAKSESNQLNIPGGAKTATIWIELAPDARFDRYQLQVFDQAKRLVTTVNGAKLNSYGALAVNVATRTLQPAKYVVKAFGEKGGQRELIGEYNLTVRK